CLDEPLFGDFVQQLDGVVLRIVPEGRIQSLEERPRLLVPAPPEVVSELFDASDARWNLPFGHRSGALASIRNSRGWRRRWAPSRAQRMRGEGPGLLELAGLGPRRSRPAGATNAP